MVDLPHDYKETLIRLDHEAKTAEIWTEHRGVLARAKRCGWTVKKQHGKGTWLVAPLRAVLIRKVPIRASRQTQAGQFKPISK